MSGIKSIYVLRPPKMLSKMTKSLEGEFIYKSVSIQRPMVFEKISEKTSFRQISIDISDFLTSSEIDDLETSLKEIEEGKAKKFKNVNEFLEELKH